MSETQQWLVTRRPGSPGRRAGLAWPEGESTVAGLSPAQVDDLRADPGYTVSMVAALPAAPEPKGKRT